MTVYKATDLYTQTWAHVRPNYTAEHGAYDVVMLDEAREAINHARREERERIAQYVESIDPGYELSVRHTITTFAEAIRAMPEEEHDGRD
jgi:3-hydroxyacyl-CoA dehydrogenase